MKLNCVTNVAFNHGRKYITPEDVGNALKTYTHEAVMLATLEVLGKQTSFGAEDSDLCAFVAFRGKEKKVNLTQKEKTELEEIADEICGQNHYCGCSECVPPVQKTELEQLAEDTGIFGNKPVEATVEDVLKALEKEEKDNTLDTILIRLKKVIIDQCGIDKDDIENSMSLKNFDFDSLDEVELVMAIEEEFGIEVPDEEAKKAEKLTVIEIAKRIQHYLIPFDNTYVQNKTQYFKGKKEGMKDRKTNTFPKYLDGDERDGDSRDHNEYILGYLDGYKG